MFQDLLNAGDAAVDWLFASVFAPVLAMLLDHPWLAGAVLAAVLVLVAVDTVRVESAESRANREEAEATRREVFGR